MNRASLYLAAWRAVPRLPMGFVLGVTRAAADIAWALHGRPVRMLGSNISRVLGRRVTGRELRHAVESHFRTYAEQFAMAGISPADLDASVSFNHFDRLRELTADGPAILALTHSGNWDLAGAWVTHQGLPILTVAERLDPPALFDAFVSFREGLGMEIIGAGKGESVFPRLVASARGRSILVPLLADRDVTGSGIEVDLAGHRALVAAGPAALAERLGCPLVAAVIHYERTGRRWRTVVDTTEPVRPPGRTESRTGVETHTQAWVDAVAPLLRAHATDWHMMQPVLVSDLDPERLARSRAAHRREQEAGEGQ